MSLQNDLRFHARMSGRSTYAIAKDADIDVSQLSRFMRNRQTLGSATADRLASVLGLRLVREQEARVSER